MSCLSNIYVINPVGISGSEVTVGSILYYDEDFTMTVSGGYYSALSQSGQPSLYKYYNVDNSGIVTLTGSCQNQPLTCSLAVNPVMGWYYGRGNSTVFAKSGFLDAGNNKYFEIRYPSGTLGSPYLSTYLYVTGGVYPDGQEVEISGSGVSSSFISDITENNNTAFVFIQSQSIAAMTGSQNWTLNVALDIYSGSDSGWGLFASGTSVDSFNTSSVGRYSLFGATRVPTANTTIDETETTYGNFSYESWIDWNKNTNSMSLCIGYLTGSQSNTTIANIELYLVSQSTFNLTKLHPTESQMITLQKSGSVLKVYQNSQLMGQTTASWNPFDQIVWDPTNFQGTPTAAGLSIGEPKWLYSLSQSLLVEYMTVGGGGGGGQAGPSPSGLGPAAGGGAGGLRTGSAAFNFGKSYTIVVGAGGSGNGGNTTISGSGLPFIVAANTIGAYGGGVGGSARSGQNDGGDGGSGGGGCYAGTDQGSAGRALDQSAGNSGGNAIGQGAGGGGGAGSGGSPGLTGGNGAFWLDGFLYSVGGNGANAVTNPASGSGGGGGAASSQLGSIGGNGIAKIRYQSSVPLATGGIITSASGYIYHSFEGPGTQTLTFNTPSASNNTLLKGLQFSDIRGITLYSRSLSDSEIFSDYNYFIARCLGTQPTTTTTTTTSTTTTTTTTTTTSTTTTLGPEIITRGLSSYLNFNKFFSASIENNDKWYDSVQLVSESACSRIIGIDSADEGCGENRTECGVYLSTGSFNAWDWPNIFNCNKSVFFPTGAFASSSNQTYVFYGAWDKDSNYGFVRNRNYQTSLQRANKIYSSGSNIVLETFWNNGTTHTLDLPITASSFTSSSLSMLTVRVENGNTASVFQNGNLIVTKETSSLNFQSINQGYTYWLDSDDVADYTMFAHSMLIYTASLTNNEISRLSTAINNNITGSY